MNDRQGDRLTDAVLGLRAEVERYRTLLQAYARRGTAVLVIAVVVLTVLFAVLLTSLYTSRTNADILSDLERAEVQRTENTEQHRIRNELLHECLVDLVFSIITTTPEDRPGAIENPCPDPLTAAELRDPPE